MIDHTIPDYRADMIRLITAYINNDKYVSQDDYFECIDYLLDFNNNRYHDLV